MASEENMTDNVTEESVNIAAQLWCLPKHQKKVMDPDLAFDIAQALDARYADAVRKCAEICEKSVKQNGEFLECEMTPYQIRDAILALLEKPNERES